VTAHRAGLLAAAAASFLAPAAVASCERHADIRDEREQEFVAPPQLDAGDIPELDSGLGGDAFPACAERPVGSCAGPIDFPCAFAGWVDDTAESCQQATGCKTNGWLEVHMGNDGCVAAIGMDEPNAEIVGCLLEEFGSVTCPCTAEEETYFFGNDNDGTCPTGG